jgi:hypothetical protein
VQSRSAVCSHLWGFIFVRGQRVPWEAVVSLSFFLAGSLAGYLASAVWSLPRALAGGGLKASRWCSAQLCGWCCLSKGCAAPVGRCSLSGGGGDGFRPYGA